MIVVFSNFLNVDYSTVKDSTGDNVTAQTVRTRSAGYCKYEQNKI